MLALSHELINLYGSPFNSTAPRAGRMPIFNAAFVLGEESAYYEAEYHLVKSE